MRLLYVIPNPKDTGGVQRSVERISTQMERIGHEIEVFCPDFEALSGKPNPEMVRAREEFKGTKMRDWTQRTIEKIQEFKPEIVVGYYATTAGFVAVAACTYLDVPVVISLRGSDMHRDFFSVIHSHKLRFAVTKADAVAAVSSDMKRQAEKWLDTETVFISNSVDKELFRPRLEASLNFKRYWGLDERPVVAMFGEFKASRGLDLLTKLKPVLENCQVVMVGVEKNNSLQGLNEWVKFVPYIRDNESLVAAYSAVDIVLQPSKYDGMPNVILEAMACEKVVLASPVGGAVDLIEHGKNGYLCSSVEDWKHNLSAAVNNPDRASMGAYARATIYGPKEESDAFISLFESVLEKRRAAAPWVVEEV